MQCVYKNLTVKRAAFMHSVPEKRSTQWKVVVIERKGLLSTPVEKQKIGSSVSFECRCPTPSFHFKGFHIRTRGVTFQTSQFHYTYPNI